MVNNIYIPLNRSVVSISGADASQFLQGVISNDINKVSKDNAIYTFLLTPQGKYLYDFFITKTDNGFLIEIEYDYVESFLKKLKIYKLRSNVEIEDKTSEFEVCALLGDNVFNEIQNSNHGKTIKFCKGVAYIDPRSQKMFARSIIERENEYKSFGAKGFDRGGFEEYQKLRILNNIPEGFYDLDQEKSFPLQYRMKSLMLLILKKVVMSGRKLRQELITGELSENLLIL